MRDYLSHSAAHYLMAIRDLLDEHGYARGVDIAARLGISRPAAYLALRALKDRGLVSEDARHFFSLPDDVQTLAARLRGNQEILAEFFRDILDLPPEEAVRSACDIEHHLSENISVALLAFLRFLRSDSGGRRLLERFHAERRRAPGRKRTRGSKKSRAGGARPSVRSR